MSFSGPQLEPRRSPYPTRKYTKKPQIDANPIWPVIGNPSIWQWIFEGDELLLGQSTSADPALSQTRGFHDSATSEFLSFHDLKSIATIVSTILHREYDVRPGQKIAIIGQNSIWYPVAMLAASRLGAVVTLLPPGSMRDDLMYFLGTSKTALVFTDEGTVDEVTAACKAIGLSAKNILRFDGSKDETNSLQNLRQRGESLYPSSYTKSWEPKYYEASPCAFLSWSSGTTGKPKAVQISHANIISQLRQISALTPPNRRRTVLGVLPFYHITGLVHLLHLPIVLEQQMVIMAKFDMKQMMETVVRFKCDELWLVPPLLIRLLNDKSAQGYDLSFVKQFNTGAAPLADQVIAQLARKFPSVAVRQAWGMTETTSCLTVTPPNLSTWSNASKVGKLVPGTEIRVVDPDTGEDVPAGNVGEIWAKGPQVTMGYLDRPEETAASYLEDGFFKTGDLGSIDNEGFITIHDRIKEMIKVRGHAVAPAELEDLLHGHPKVKDAAIIGIPDDYSGETPRAFVVLAGGVHGGPEVVKELQEFVAARKAKHKRLSGGVEFMDQIPKSPSGKILRRVLKASWKEKMESQRAKL
ncbi:4-coumarate--CoA ligase-like 5 [Fusarium odoratissimum]|uniref:4-coumarate--CoA ligase-like 5 n=1 Tax=Fusarium oxysporum f. sp. cubense (strain race 4) TaxID=2502994 RepID=N1SA71_FUSC4|nr:4-coumarate--CoA ligase-like 5 [Fusarium odoratissimum]